MKTLSNVKMEESLSQVTSAAAEATFVRTYPEYQTTRILDDLRATEYGRLDRLDHVYLDYTGGGLYADFQIRTHADLLLSNVFGNPHSTNPTSLATTRLVEQARKSVLEFFSASPEEYVVIFTLNASGALKLVGESYPFTAGDQYLLTFDNHNSVNGIREFAHARGAQVTYLPMLPPTMRIDEKRLMALLRHASPDKNNLFVYPAQSNFSGVQHPLEWIPKAQAKGWDVLLDAAAFVPTNRLDLSQWHPDFVPISFYKIFGYPTGVGCLLARHTALAKLQRPWFAGGTITVVSVQGNRHYFQPGAEAFEDGTLNYLDLSAIEIGLRHITQVGIDTIHTRVRCLTSWLLSELAQMRHSNGERMVRIYGPLDTTMRGGTIALNLYDPRGQFIDYRLVEQRANQVNISLRTGCFCNPGSGELALGLETSELNACFADKSQMTLDDFRQCIDGKSTGAVRISVGLVTNFHDVYRLTQFIRGFMDRNFESQ